VERFNLSQSVVIPTAATLFFRTKGQVNEE
jgi:hypothetical protein